MITIFFFLLLFMINPVSPSISPDRFTRSLSLSSLRRSPQQYFELTHPSPSDQLTPTCSHLIVRHSFANTIDSPPFSTAYSLPSDCSIPWSRVVLEFHAQSKGEQYDRIAGLWLGGVEIFRTSTAEPTESGIFWKVRKDVTRYSSLFVRSGLDVTMMLENIVDNVYTGVYRVEVRLFFYKDDLVRVPSTFGDNRLRRKLGVIGGNLGFEGARFDEHLGIGYTEHVGTPAHLIIPVSDNGHDRGYWFRIENELDSHSKGILLPRNTRRAVLELYVSFHGSDEFWYSNPPDSYIITNNLTTGRGNGAYREIYVTIDGKFVGSEVPYPVIFTGGINPLFWEPVVGIGAFDLPTYNFELTPFLGMLLDGKVHNFAIGVTNGISYWLVDANLHLWLDHNGPLVQAELGFYHSPAVRITRVSRFKQLDGSFSIEAERRLQSVGWVKSSEGNYTTIFSQEYQFKNMIRFNNDGNHKIVRSRIRARREVKVQNDGGTLIAHARVESKYPLNVATLTRPGKKPNRYMLETNVSRTSKDKYINGDSRSSFVNNQNSVGSMQVKDHSVLSGEATTNQSLVYKDGLDCYLGFVSASNGKLIRNDSTLTCPSSV